MSGLSPLFPFREQFASRDCGPDRADLMSGRSLRLEAVHLEGLIEWRHLARRGRGSTAQAAMGLLAGVHEETLGHRRERGRVSPAPGEILERVATRERVSGVLGLPHVFVRIHDTCGVKG
jgi:hypothetical protein